MFSDTLIDPLSGRLLEAVREFASARELDEVTAVVRRHARSLTGADGVTFVLRDRDQCYYVDEEAIAPLWKGQRFSMDACISGWVMRHATPAVIEDIYADNRVPHSAYRPTFVRSAAMVPIRSEEPIGAIGAYWATGHEPTESEVEVLQVLADFASVALRNVELLEAMEGEKARYRAIVEDQTELIIRWSPDGALTFANEACTRFFQLPLEELQGRDLLSLVHESDRAAVEKKIRGLTPDAPSATDQRRSLVPDGSTIWTEWVDRAVYDDSDRLREYQSVGRDISSRMALEEQLRQTQKMDAIGRLAGGVAHDFNNVLTVVSGHCGLALGRLEADDPLRVELEAIESAVARAHSLTRQLLAVSRSQPMDPEVVDLNRVVEKMEQMLRRLVGEQVELVTHLESDLGSVWADVSRIEQVVLNLSVNARDAMPEGGRLTLETRNVELTDETTESGLDIEPGAYVMLAASDEGTGMTREIQEHLFEPFYTTKAESKGTGLGLSIVFGIVKQCRGSIYVYSEPGLGTTFKIYLPRIEAAERSPEPPAPSPEGPPGEPGGETVLVVEDDDHILGLATRILEDAGYEVLGAANPEEARRLFEARKVDLLITDMVLPEVGGVDLATELRVASPSLPIVFVSGYTEHGLGDYRSVSRVFLEKPFTADTLLEKTREAIELERTREGPASG